MNVSELRKLSEAELVDKCNASVVELKKVKFELKSNNINPENINKHRELKKDIAKIKTILNELKLINN